jgi:Zn-dependent protease with chaperone function
LPQGYHILILDSEEAHAFAAPGGFVLITRGLLKLTTSEDMLAALLAHEISHSALGHGLVSLASYRMGDLAMYYAALSTQQANADNKETAALLSAAVHDFVSLISVQGYSQAMEFEADAEAMRMLYETGTGMLRLKILYICWQVPRMSVFSSIRCSIRFRRRD